MTLLYLSNFKKWLNEEQARQQNLNWEEFFTSAEEYFCQNNWQNIEIPCVIKTEEDSKVLDEQVNKITIKEWITDLFSSSVQHGEVFCKWAFPYLSPPKNSLFGNNKNHLCLAGRVELSYEVDKLKTENKDLKKQLVDKQKLEEGLITEKSKLEQEFQFSESQLKIFK